MSENRDRESDRIRVTQFLASMIELSEKDADGKRSGIVRLDFGFGEALRDLLADVRRDEREQRPEPAQATISIYGDRSCPREGCVFSNGHECICRDADGDALESLPNSGKEFPPCSYIGGDEDPSKCNSSRCPRHSKMGIHTCDRCPAERPIGRMRCMACEAKIGKHNIDTHGIDCGCPACSAQTAAMRRQSTQDGGDDPVLAERERCARIVEVLAHFMETGAGPLNAPGARLRQAARGIRDGEPSVLWDESHREDKKYELPVPSCGHGAQAWCIACHECGDMPDERRIIASAPPKEKP